VVLLVFLFSAGYFMAIFAFTVPVGCKVCAQFAKAEARSVIEGGARGRKQVNRQCARPGHIYPEPYQLI
jgi:hypothetical protein